MPGGRLRRSSTSGGRGCSYGPWAGLSRAVATLPLPLTCRLRVTVPTRGHAARWPHWCKARGQWDPCARVIRTPQGGTSATRRKPLVQQVPARHVPRLPVVATLWWPFPGSWTTVHAQAPPSNELGWSCCTPALAGGRPVSNLRPRTDPTGQVAAAPVLSPGAHPPSHPGPAGEDPGGQQPFAGVRPTLWRCSQSGTWGVAF